MFNTPNILFDSDKLFKRLLFSILLINVTFIFNQETNEPFIEFKKDKEYSPEKINSPPKIDGILNDSCWLDKIIINDFEQDEPYNKTKPTEQTEVIIVYDNSALYIAAFLYDSKISDIQTRRIKKDDWMRVSISDWFSIEIDSYHSHQSAFEFLVNSSGTQFDDYIYDDIDRDPNWDAVWESEIFIDNKGWYVEMKIPFSQLRYSNLKNQTWGININRYLNRNSEFISWVVLPREKNGIASKFGHLTNMSNIKNEVTTTITPYYILGSVNYNDYELKDANKGTFGHVLLDSVSLTNKFGFDIKKYISSNSILDISFNPDFGQIESDPDQINLSVYETYFEERRPFFMESATLFDTPVEVFYSRKIGMNHSYISGRWNEPKDALIKGAIKLSGKTENGFSYGLITAITTDEKYGNWINKMENGLNTNFIIGRITKDFFSGNSYLGFMNTHYSNINSSSDVLSIDGLSYLFDNKLYMDSQFIVSNIDNDLGKGLSLESHYTGENNILTWIDFEYFDKKLNLSHVGYLYRNNYKAIKLGVKKVHSEIVAFQKIRSMAYGIASIYAANIDDLVLDRKIITNLNITFNNNWYTNFKFYYQFEHKNDLLLFDYNEQMLQSMSPIATIPINFGFTASCATDINKPFSIAYLFSLSKNTFNDVSLGTNFSANFHNDFSSLSFSWISHSSEIKYYWLDIIMEVEPDTIDHYIFSNATTNTNRFTLRYNINVVRNLDVQFYSEYFSTNNFYKDYSELVPLSNYPIMNTSFIAELDHIYYSSEDLKDDPNPDVDQLINPNEYVYLYSNDNRFTLNFVMNWEYLPGNNLYFVVTRNRSVTGKDLNSLIDLINYIPKYYDLSELYRNYSIFVRLDYKISI